MRMRGRKGPKARPRVVFAGVLVALGALVPACRGGPGTRDAAGSAEGAATAVHDIHSYSRPEDARVTHADIDWTVDFEKRRIGGAVTWTVERPAGAASAPAPPLVLDTRGLVIETVTTPAGAPVPHASGEEHAALGTPLRIHLPADQDRVVIRYHTTPGAAALQWLAPEQTAGKAKPFLFSQGQSILVRTMLPCQDSPGVRFTYTATVRTPPGLTAVMAAKRLEDGAAPAAGAEPGAGAAGGVFRFEMPQPIPSYLVAVAVGDLAFRPLGPRSGVFAEPSVVEKAAWEFADTEKMIAATEALYGPYRWDRYDILVLPPSFPFGGMENPRLTFATPTILAGDRSLVALVAHELAHSWSGNLVTNATWEDFWLNEGFTVYLERRIVESIYGRERSEMDAVLGKQDLVDEMKTLAPGDTALHNVSLEGRDPDDAFSEVPYEKGYLLLRLVEEKVGREPFDAFLRAWFDQNAFRSRTTAEFDSAVRARLFPGDAAGPETLRLKEWLHDPGLPANAPVPSSPPLDRAAAAAAAVASGAARAADLPGKTWSTQEWLHFLRALPPGLDTARMAALDAAWGLTRSGNSEILSQWLIQSIRSGYAPADPALERFLTSMGRRKFLKPLYTELAKTPAGKAKALAIYRKARPTYHTVAATTIDAILGVRA